MDFQGVEVGRQPIWWTPRKTGAWRRRKQYSSPVTSKRAHSIIAAGFHMGTRPIFSSRKRYRRQPRNTSSSGSRKKKPPFVRKSLERDYCQHWQCYLKHRFGSREVASIGVSDLKELRRSLLAENLKLKTVK